MTSALHLAQVHAAACCGGGLAAPALILGDDKAQVTMSYGYSQVLDDVDDQALWRPRDTLESTETYKFEVAHIVGDRWQSGLSIPVVRRAMAGSSSTGLGDVAGTVGYEFLPEWDYSPWRPKGVGFFQLTLPTGKSVDESDAIYQLDSRGRGFWAIGVGTVLTKNFGNWDAFTNFDVHRSFKKSYSNSQSQGTLQPGFGGNLGGGGGYNWSNLRFGSSLTWTYEDPVNVTGTVSSQGAAQRYATAAFTFTYLLKHDWSTTLTYADQTLFGDPVNTTLGRGAILQVQKRWPR